MEKSFAQVRKELDDLGYTETLKPECLPLVRRLLGDLKITTESLRKYMKISQQALEVSFLHRNKRTLKSC